MRGGIPGSARQPRYPRHPRQIRHPPTPSTVPGTPGIPGSPGIPGIPRNPAPPASPGTLHSPRYPRCPRYPRQPPAAPIRLSRRQLGNRWQTKGSPLKLVPTWFLLIDSGSSTGGKRVVLDINYLWVHSLRLRSAFSQGPRR